MNKINLKFLNSAFILTLLLAGVVVAPSVHAVEYDVEVIIFENVRDTAVGSSDTLLLPVVRDAQQIPDAPVPGATVQPIGELRLLNEVDKIKSSNNHRLLYHGGWRQGEIDEENAPYMSISLGGTFNLLTEQGDPDSQFLRGYLTPPVDTQLQLSQRRSARLQGGIKVWVGRFLHFETLLAYTKPGADHSFAFVSDRRMRSRQMHYIDNSKVGIITKIFPVDNSAPN